MKILNASFYRRQAMLEKTTPELPFGINHFIRRYEPKSLHPSQTIPDQSLPLKDLLARYVRGEAISSQQPVFEEDFPGVERLDFDDKIRLAEDIRAGIQVERQKRTRPPQPAPPVQPQPPAPSKEPKV